MRGIWSGFPTAGNAPSYITQMPHKSAAILERKQQEQPEHSKYNKI